MIERDKPHSYQHEPSAPMVNYSLLIMEREMAMKMALVVMKMAPGAIPRPGRMPERSFCPPNLDFGVAAARNFSGSLVNILRVYSAGAIYGRKGSSG